MCVRARPIAYAARGDPPGGRSHARVGGELNLEPSTSRRRQPELEDYDETRKFDERLDKPIFRLYSILREKGIRVLGITSERRMGENFIAAIPFCGLRENVKILYVGQHNSFTKRRRNQTLSVLPIDKRYKDKENENLLNG